MPKRCRPPGGRGLRCHSGRHHRAEGALSPRVCSTSSMPAFAQQHFGVDDVDLFFQRVFEQSGGKSGRDQPGVLAGHFAAIVERAALDRSGVELGQKQAQAIGHVEIAAQVGQSLGDRSA